MSDKGYYQGLISQYQAQIKEIEADIKQMRQEQKNFAAYGTSFSNNKTNVDNYDMTVGGTWRKNLCDTAQDKQKAISKGVSDAITQCNTVKSELETCIANAKAQIEELKGKIAACEAEIRRIEAQEKKEKDK